MLARLWRRVKRALHIEDLRISPEFQRRVDMLTSDSVAVDCGANVGTYTRILARSGARVFAFEPDPAAFALLARRMRRYPNVQIYNQAVAASAGTAKLYFHANRATDPLLLSQGSSLIAAKNNVGSDGVDVETVAFADFIAGLPAPVSLLKMDIEGAEIDVLNDLIDRGLSTRVEFAFVELHDRKTPALAQATDALRARIAEIAKDRFDLTWH